MASCRYNLTVVLHRNRFLVVSLALIAPAAATRAQSLLKESPFNPAPGPNAAFVQPTAPGTYEFVGMTVVGNVTLLSINRVSDKHSFWVPLGKTVNQITAMSYDPRSETAVVRAENQTLTLKMRKAMIAPAGAAPAFASTLPPAQAPAMPSTEVEPPPPPPPNAGPPPAMTDEDKANEARMLVSDLLEIGQRQRQAYEEAQRQANARARATPPPAATDTKR